jgi:hypothetical protein
MSKFSSAFGQLCHVLPIITAFGGYNRIDFITRRNRVIKIGMVKIVSFRTPPIVFIIVVIVGNCLISSIITILRVGFWKYS